MNESIDKKALFERGWEKDPNDDNDPAAIVKAVFFKEFLGVVKIYSAYHPASNQGMDQRYRFCLFNIETGKKANSKVSLFSVEAAKDAAWDAIKGSSFIECWKNIDETKHKKEKA